MKIWDAGRLFSALPPLMALQAGLAVSLSAAAADASGPPTGKAVYLEDPHRSLTVYYPDDWKATDRRPALVIFRSNLPSQREHFRKLGMVIFKPQTAPVNSGKLPGMTLDEIRRSPATSPDRWPEK